MAPTPKGQSKPASSASGHAKKQHPASVPVPAAAVATPTNRGHVVPAIPLTLMHKQSTSTSTTAAKSRPQHAPTFSASSNNFPVSSLEAALIDHDPVHSAKKSENKVNSQGLEKPEQAVESSPSPITVRQSRQSPPQMNGVGHANSDSHDSTAAFFADAESTVGSSSGAEATRGANGGSVYASQPQSATSTTRPEFPSSLPAPLHPLQHQHIGEQHHPAFHGPHPHHMHPHQHRHQMSNGGGIMFGGFDSHSPSPAPPPGGFMPPPLPPVNGENRGHPNGHNHTHSNSNGFPGPINTHFRGDMVPMSTMDAYGTVPAPAPPGHFEAYIPGVGRYGPPTPHSFHGSHASGEPNGMDNAPLPYPPTGSYAAHSRQEHPVAHQHPYGLFPPFTYPPPPSRQIKDDEPLTERIARIRSQFDNGELADCVLELVSAKGRHHPVKISGHKFILADSPALKQHIMTARATDPGSHTITMEVDDLYLRSDAWWMAVQRLYLHPLLDPPPMMGNGGNGMEYAGDKADQFDFCLGYAAAGHVLAMQDVFLRGVVIACNTLTWDTVEAALGFVLEASIQRYYDTREPEEADMPSAYLEFGYGPNTRILLVAIINFLVHEFPANFELDNSVLDTPNISRLPASSPTSFAPTSASLTKVAPAIARGTSTRPPPKVTRLSSIKFGDLPAAYLDDAPWLHREPAKCSPILSRILLNLPYDELSQVLTSRNSNGVSAWNTAQDRYHAVIDVVAEREARRLRAVEAVRSGSMINAHEIQLRLSAPHRHPNIEEWDVLNWQEEVIRAETPRIVRRWVPQFDVAQQPTLPRPSYDIPDSMV